VKEGEVIILLITGLCSVFAFAGLGLGLIWEHNVLGFGYLYGAFMLFWLSTGIIRGVK